MEHTEISCFLNDKVQDNEQSAFSFANTETAADVHKFHKSLPDYKPTPLVDLSSLSRQLGMKKLMIKDESKRFGLNAFKVLGASYAVSQYLKQKLNIKKTDVSFDELASFTDQLQDITFVTATDGNHGRAVAWVAEKFGCRAVVYLPSGSSETRLEAIQQHGAKAAITEFNYDETVVYAEKMAAENDWVLLQDTSWPGYEKIPLNIMNGYCTLASEYLQQEEEWPTHIFLQAGVGSFAAAVLASFSCISGKPKPTCIIVEPKGAPCLFNSMKLNNGNPSKVEGDLPTIMAGLACGEPSLIGLQVLKKGAAAFIKCSDHLAERGMKILGAPLPGDPRIISGESGAVTLGVVFELYTNSKLTHIKEALGISQDSKILLFSTEGDTDPEMYYKIVWA